jgi:hypothetical protein
MKLSIMQFSPVFSYFLPLKPKECPQPVLTLIVLHPFKRTGKTVVLYALMFGFLDSKQGGRRFWKIFNLL